MRYILHIDLDTFFVSVERLQNPELNGKPVICGGHGERDVVSSASYEARKFGVHSGMSIVKAMKLCPQAIICDVRKSDYMFYSQQVAKIVDERAPLYQQMSIDEYFIDLSGMEKYFDVNLWAHNLRMEIITKTRLPISYGLSVNRTVAKIASGRAKPMGELFIPQEKVQEFLDPLPVEKIPGVGDVFLPKLHKEGIYTILQLRQYPRGLFIHQFGRSSENIWLKANGIDNSPVEPAGEPKSLSQETTFETDVWQHEKIKDVVCKICDNLAFKLRSEKKLCNTVAVKIKNPNFTTNEKQKSLPPTDYTDTLTSTALALFDVLHKKQPIRLVGVRFSISTSNNAMNNIFEYSPKKQNLYKAIDSLKEKFGKEIIKKGNAK